MNVCMYVYIYMGECLCLFVCVPMSVGLCMCVCECVCVLQGTIFCVCWWNQRACHDLWLCKGGYVWLWNGVFCVCTSCVLKRSVLVCLWDHERVQEMLGMHFTCSHGWGAMINQKQAAHCYLPRLSDGITKKMASQDRKGKCCDVIVCIPIPFRG